ncbi:MAG: nucleotidyltransferase family protein [Tepidisphaeraceae bacterium]
MILYEDKLDADLNWALREGSLHFEEKNAVHDTLRRITRRLNELQIPYAVVGGMAMFAHGFRRFTEDVDLLVTRESMDEILEKLEGLGYVKPAGTSSKLRDTQTGVKIEFLITGGFPGDGKPKPVSFPDPTTVMVEIEGVQYLGLATLLELKLASGMTGGVNRLKDLADVVELTKTLSLTEEFAAKLNPYVRDKFLELHRGIKISAE